MKTEADTGKCRKTRDELLAENARLRGDLLTISRRISHDLRTPLGGIMSAGDVMKETFTDHSSLGLVTSVLNSADELSVLIRRVSFVAQASAVQGSFQPMDMGEAVSAAVMNLATKITRAGAKLSQPDSWPEIKGVSDWMEVVWWNLLANALQHAGSKPRIELGWREENKKFRFWVSDHGPGVSGEKRKGLFKPFQFLHELNAPRGLGLSIVQRLVELQGGHCGYESNRPRGGCFFFVLG